MLLKMRLYKKMEWREVRLKNFSSENLTDILEGKWQICWVIAFDLGTLHASSQLTLTGAQGGWYYYFHFTNNKKGYIQKHSFNNSKMTRLFHRGPYPDSNSDEHVCNVPERRKCGLSHRDLTDLCITSLLSWSPPSALYKDFHKCHNLNNSNIQN